MQEIKYYDVITKQEIAKEQIKPNVPYLTLGEKWKIRLTTINRDGSSSEKFLTLQEEAEAKQEILRVNLLEKGYVVHSIKQANGFDIDNLHLNVPNYTAQVQDRQGKLDDIFFNTTTLENLVRTDGNERYIELNNCTLQNQSLIENVSRDVSTQSSSTQIIINIDQWGFKGTYDLSKKEDYTRLLTDQKIMPKSKEEAMNHQSMRGE